MNHYTRPARLTEQHVVALASKLTERDRQIALDCYEHRVLTTEQLRRLHFTGQRTARNRLRELYQLRVLDRFRPAWRRGEGSTPSHWVLDEAGAWIVAEELGIERRELRWRHAAAISVASSTKLAHQLDVNELFTRLAADARNADGALREWYGERTTRDLLDGIVIPDGYSVLELPQSAPLHLLVELDRGTEDHARLRDKAAGYARALPRGALAELNPAVLLIVGSRDRAAALDRGGGVAPLRVAVWSPATQASALDAVLDACPEPAGSRPVPSQSFPTHKGPAPAATT